MSDLISRNEVLEELNKYEKELRKDKAEAIETDDEQMMFAIMNQETSICRIRRNILHMQTAYDIDKVVEELRTDSSVKLYGSNNSGNYLIPVNRAIEIVKQGGVSDDVCEWHKVKNGNAYKCNTHAEIHDSRVLDWCCCPYCGKKIKVVE